ncbi:ECF RNA polymerase sigma factor RpoE [Paenibacillus plantiphilus]|uniref:ECF RNA polymerase sigma factor RpoE n=1 Tax=Paenibacillus plantiphilus TaxID=2905650 RepID=A0ABN8GEK4_9BACL|nr:RNA polymerase sigma factor [Paenibacillus plantiphilus]CAH1203859.1 ECF RNA polymerase sigma factor RpoE [Paenibacillus plantiphilus]
MDKEKQWIRKIKKNANKSAANELVSKYYNEMYVFVFKQTLDEQLSLDLTQEIFITVLKSIANYDEGKASFRTWLYKLATNRLVDYYRSRSYKDARRVESIEEYEFEDHHDLTVSLEYKEEFEKVTSLVNQLDAVSQHIMRLKLFGEYTFQEIAMIETIPESTVKTKYYAALKRIREEVREDSYE